MSDSHGFEARHAVTNANHKRMLSSEVVDVNQLLPIKYQWAWDAWMKGNENHWLPSEVAMGADAAQWKSNDILSDPERQLLMRVFGFMSTAESLVAGNLILGVYPNIQPAEVRQYLIRQIFEEGLHSHMFLHIIESLGLDEQEVYGAYAEIPTIHAKDEFEMALTRELIDGTLDMSTIAGKKVFLRNLIGYYVILEGIFFYGGFAMIESLNRQNKMVGIGQQFAYTRRDEGIHVSVGVNIIRTIIEENPELWDRDMEMWFYDQIEHATMLEQQFTKELLPEGYVGMNLDQLNDYILFIANRRCEQMGMSPMFTRNNKPIANPLQWMSESYDLLSESNFFEARVIDYRKASALSWD